MNQAAAGFHNALSRRLRRAAEASTRCRLRGIQRAFSFGREKTTRISRENLSTRSALGLTVARRIGSAALSRFHALHTAAVCSKKGTKRDFRRRIFHGLISEERVSS